MLSSQFVSDLVAEDFLHPFNDFEGADELIVSFAPRSVSEGSVTIDGLCYALPVRSNSIEYFYNVDHFEEVGLDPNNPPKTWDEMMDAAIKLTKKDSAGNTIRYGCDAVTCSRPFTIGPLYSGAMAVTTSKTAKPASIPRQV